MVLSLIRMELVRDPDFPQGSRRHGYEFVAPLDMDDHIAVKEWEKNKELCHVKRFWGDAEVEVGHLIRKPGGNWAFHYDLHGAPDDDETGYRFASHTFRIGDYVSINEHDDVLRTFRVVSVQDVPEHVAASE